MAAPRRSMPPIPSPARSQITDTTYGYDALGRNNTITDWTGTTTFKFFDDGSVSEVDYPDGRSQTVNATDPKSGTPTNVTLPNGQSQNQTLNSRGQQQTQNGAGVLPARFTYDDKTGALTGMNLFQSGTFDGTPETTTWAYDPATGLLTKKTYNDGTSDVYDYNAKFQLTSLTRPGVFINYHYAASGRQTTSDATDNTSARSRNAQRRLRRRQHRQRQHRAVGQRHRRNRLLPGHRRQRRACDVHRA